MKLDVCRKWNNIKRIRIDGLIVQCSFILLLHVEELVELAPERVLVIIMTEIMKRSVYYENDNQLNQCHIDRNSYNNIILRVGHTHGIVWPSDSVADDSGV